VNIQCSVFLDLVNSCFLMMFYKWSPCLVLISYGSEQGEPVLLFIQCAIAKVVEIAKLRW